jgi:hypothetical protein
MQLSLQLSLHRARGMETEPILLLAFPLLVLRLPLTPRPNPPLSSSCSRLGAVAGLPRKDFGGGGSA